jgi:hypothetical protein
MRPKGMNKLSMPVFALAATAVLAGCANQSGSTASSPATTPPATTPAATTPAAATSQGTPTGSPTSAGPASKSLSAPAPSSSTATTSGPAHPLVPAGATSATLTYVGPTSAQRLHATKTVTGATYQRLLQDLNALEPVSGVVQCMVLTGESASVTITGGGHTAVFTVDGSPCRGVAVTEDGVQKPRLNSSTTLLNQVRAIAGFNGMARPLTG